MQFRSKSNLFNHLKTDVWGSSLGKPKLAKSLDRLRQEARRSCLSLNRSVFKTATYRCSEELGLFLRRKVPNLLARPKRKTFYGTILAEKQKVRYFSPSLKERTLRKLFTDSENVDTFFQTLELRVDRALSRSSGVSPFSISQYVSHGFVRLNGLSLRRVSAISVGDIVEVALHRFQSMSSKFFRPIADYLIWDHRLNAFIVVRKPSTADYLYAFPVSFTKFGQFYKGRFSG